MPPIKIIELGPIIGPTVYGGQRVCRPRPTCIVFFCVWPFHIIQIASFKGLIGLKCNSPWPVVGTANQKISFDNR